MTERFPLAPTHGVPYLRLYYPCVRSKEGQESVTQKTVLLIDDEQGMLEALEDALVHEALTI
jgi:hypothetical protein